MGLHVTGSHIVIHIRFSDTWGQKTCMQYGSGSATIFTPPTSPSPPGQTSHPNWGALGLFMAGPKYWHRRLSAHAGPRLLGPKPRSLSRLR